MFTDESTLVPEAFFYSFLANFATRWHEALRAEKRKPMVKTVGILTSCHQLFTVVSDWWIFFIALRVI